MNFMLEALAFYTQTVTASGTVSHESDVILNPGVRFALDFGHLQVVPGFSVPLHPRGSKETDLFFYLSFEHPFRRTGAR